VRVRVRVGSMADAETVESVERWQKNDRREQALEARR
jgi:hypothetical protein